MTRGLVGGGATGIATLLAQAARTCACQAPEFGTIIELETEVMGLMPDNWTSVPFRPGTYDVLQPLDVGMYELILSASNTPEVRTLIRELEDGDRVLLLWVGHRPVVVGRLGMNRGGAGNPNWGEAWALPGHTHA